MDWIILEDRHHAPHSIPRPVGGLVTAVVLLAACQRDPGRDVEPMTDPLRGGAFVAADDDEIIPIDDVRRSQAAAVAANCQHALDTRAIAESPTRRVL